MVSFNMVPTRFRTVSQRRFTWLLWLAMLLPVAQLAASWHVLSHVGSEAGGEAAGKQAAHPTHCDLCLTAAAIAGGALVASLPALLHPAVRHLAPSIAFVGVWLASPVRAYRSRAPPVASH